MGEPSGAGTPGSGESANESYVDIPGGMSPEPSDGTLPNDALRPGRDKVVPAPFAHYHAAAMIRLRRPVGINAIASLAAGIHPIP